MKSLNPIIIALCILLLCIIQVSAENLPDNPSVYSFAEIVQKLSDIWDSTPTDIMKIMEQYPDFVCYRGYDIIGCQSVNNRFSNEIHVNYQFSSDDDNAEFVHAAFSTMIDSSEDVQDYIEKFWLPDMKVASIWGASYPDNQLTLYFSSENTIMTVNVPFAENGSLWMIMLEFGVIRG